MGSDNPFGDSGTEEGRDTESDTNEGEDSAGTNNDTSTSEELSTREKVNQQLQKAYPDVGYQHVEWDLIKPPEERILPLSYTNRLKLSEMSPRKDSELTEYSLYDSEGRPYSEKDFEKISADTGPEGLDGILEDVTGEDSKTTRIALARLATVAAEQPNTVSDACPVLEDKLSGTPPAVQAETLGILTAVAEANPSTVEHILPTVHEFLTQETYPGLRSESARLLKAIAGQEPDMVLDALPEVADQLIDEKTDSSPFAAVLNRVAKEYPGEVLPYVPKLETHLQESDESSLIPALSAVGHVANEYPNVAREVIPIAGELLDEEDDFNNSFSLAKGLLGNQEHMLRANAAAALADLAEYYPSDVRQFATDLIDILDDEDEKVRHNASLALSRTAVEHPEDIPAAVDDLLELLDDDLPGTRINACRALERGEISEATQALKKVAETDTDGEVRAAAEQALARIEY